LNVLTVFKDDLLFDENKRNAIQNYKYSGEDQSLLAPFMYKIWSKFFFLVPKRISPNVITICGLFIVSLSFVIIQMNNWSNDCLNCFLFGLALFIYQTTDALDGMQGKRVHMYENATTEIFDHGIDSIVTSLTSLTTISLLRHINRNVSPIYSLMILLTSFIGFHSPTFEHVVTRKMRFQIGFCNPTEALIGMQLFYFLTSIYPSIWTHKQAQFMLISILIPILFISSILTFYSSIKQIYFYHKNDLILTIKSILIGYSPLFFVIISSYFYLFKIESFSNKHSLLCLIVLTIPWNYSIYRTIIIEITNDQHFPTLKVLLGQSPILLPILSAYFCPSIHFLSIICSIGLSAFLYIYTVHLTLAEVCQALSMEHFWIVKKDPIRQAK